MSMLIGAEKKKTAAQARWTCWRDRLGVSGPFSHAECNIGRRSGLEVTALCTCRFSICKIQTVCGMALAFLSASPRPPQTKESAVESQTDPERVGPLRRGH